MPVGEDEFYARKGVVGVVSDACRHAAGVVGEDAAHHGRVL